ncbi:MAG: hypothetical protein JST86_17270 [Bacteroidetes bacterium]|nr:hypothetical protein [Bacteroidota bacterium]
MKKWYLLLLPACLLLSLPASSQQNGKTDAFAKANNAVNKVNNILAVFQPYLLKARQLFYDAKQLGNDVKQSSKTAFGKNGNNTNNNGYTNNTGYTDNNNNNNNNNGGYNNSQYNSGNSGNSGNSNAGNSNSNNNQGGNTQDNGGYTNSYNNNQSNNQSNNQNNNGYNNSQYNNQNNNGYQNNGGYNQGPQNYLTGQTLPVNNPATINNDGTGNWGNQNNGLYGNYLDVLTGTVMGAGEAEASPKNVDVIFVAANQSYQLWTPNYARNEVAAEYTSRSTHETAMRWTDANETEIAETKITLGQFDQIQNNSQILNAVRNAQDYASGITELDKLDGKVFAVKAELEDRTVYGLIAVVRQVGTDGSSGYLKIKIKAQGLSGAQNGQINAGAYLRQ